MAACKYNIREICGDWALDIHWGNETVVLYFNSRNNAELVKDILEWEDDHPNAAAPYKPTLTQPNDPLTLEELSSFDAPVWIKRIGDEDLSGDGWVIVEGPRCLTWHNRIPVSWGIRVWWPGSEVEDCPKYENYSKTWIAYRRPKEEQ